MIRRMITLDNNVLYYTDASGELVIASVFDPLFAQLTEVITQQENATRSNIQAYNNYMNQLNTYQGILSSGRLETTVPPVSAPTKPQYMVVADAPDSDGNPVVTFTPWPGGLPDPIQPKIFPSSGPKTAADFAASGQTTR